MEYAEWQRTRAQQEETERRRDEARNHEKQEEPQRQADRDSYFADCLGKKYQRACLIRELLLGTNAAGERSSAHDKLTGPLSGARNGPGRTR